MYSERGLFIDGAWRRTGAGREIPVVDPSSGELLGGIADYCNVKLAQVTLP